MKDKKNSSQGKIRFSVYFQDLKKGDKVSVVKEKSIASHFPKRLQGRTGEIQNKRGKTYIVKIKDQKKEKEFLIDPIHLKKIK